MPPVISRREALAGLAAAPIVSGAEPSSAFGKTGPLHDFIRMWGALDGRLVIGGLSGRYFGVVDAVPTPLFGVVSVVVTRSRADAGGGYEIAEYEQAYFTDLVTGEALKRWLNPYTGERVDVPVASQSRRTARLGLDLRFAAPMVSPGVSFEHFVEPPERFGGDVFFIEHVRALVPAAAARPEFRYDETTTLRAREADLRGAGARVACETTFDALVSWRPWMKMGDRAGHLMAWGHGRYGIDLVQAPPAWIAATRAEMPDLLLDPSKALGEPIRPAT